MKFKYSVGIDLGGSKVAVALVDSKGKVLKIKKSPVLEFKNDTNIKRGQQQLIQKIAQLVFEVIDSVPVKSVAGVGLASAGPLNVLKGELIHPVNFPLWRSLKIVDHLKQALKKKKLNLPFYFQNDAMAASFAEGWVGGAKKNSTFAVITLGTGVGTGVIFNKKPVQFQGMGSEFGHLIIQNQHIEKPMDCKKFSVEGLASGTGILRRAKEMGFQGERLEDLVQEIESGDRTYLPLFEQAADALATLCFNLSLGFHIEKFLFSGGMIQIKHLFWPRLNAQYSAWIHAFNPQFKAELQMAKAGLNAGVIGAASLALI